MSVADMMEAVGIKGRKNFREHYLNPAISSGAVQAKYPDNPRHPQQRYKLTEAAIEWKATQQA